MIYQMVYSSQENAPVIDADLELLLSQARAFNGANNVTGALVTVDGVFLQVLEGEKSVVQALMQRIAADPRHHSVKVFFEAEAPFRTFDRWQMACVQATPQQLAGWTGLDGATTLSALREDLAWSDDRLSGFVDGLLGVLAK